mgnify:CR=1 FL=1
MQKLAAQNLDDKEAVEDLLSQYRQEHMLLLKQKEQEQQRMTEKLKEKLRSRTSGSQDDGDSNFSSDFYAKIWEIEKESGLTDDDIFQLIKEHLKSEKKKKRRSYVSQYTFYYAFHFLRGSLESIEKKKIKN